MTPENLSVIEPFFLSWNLRNMVDNPLHFTSEKFGLIGTSLGEYPIDAWETYFLEVPKTGNKMDLTGRMNQISANAIKNTNWDLKRIINLPIYANSENADLALLKLIVLYWKEIHLPDDIPCLAIAVKCHGNYSDIREAQEICVLLIWNDAVGRIITLDWFEGPLEDCITPEWYVKTSPLLNLKDAFETIKKFSRKSRLENPIYSIFTLPSCLGCALKGERCKGTYKQWGPELRYSGHLEFTDDIDLLFSSIQQIFSYEGGINMQSEAEVKYVEPIYFDEIVPSEENEAEDLKKFESIINKYHGNRASVISILLDIQEEYNYLPKDALITVANRLNIRLIDVYSVATFYKVFSLKPRGKHIISVCLGTACHVRGGDKIVNKIQRELNIKVGETTEDMLFTLETVRCLGACALGPVMVIDGEYHGQMNQKKVDALLQKCTARKEST